MASALILAVVFLSLAWTLFWKIWYKERRRWQLAILQAPLMIGLLYFWIAAWQPTPDEYRPVARYTLFYVGGVGHYLVYDFLKRRMK